MSAAELSKPSRPPRIRHRVGVLLCSEVSLGSYGLALDVFRMANQLPGAHRFDIVRVGPHEGGESRQIEHEDGWLMSDAGLSALADLGMLVIPSLWTLGAQAVARHPQVCAALAALDPAKPIVTMCTGGYFLAASGRMDGLAMTTHWALAQDMQQQFPGVQLDPEPNLIEDGAVICSGGSLAGLDACLLGVERLSDRSTARGLARLLVVDARHAPQTAYMPPQGWRRHADGEVRALQTWMAEHLQEAITLESLAEQVHMSVRTLQRRFLSASGQTPMQFLQALRIDRARELLEGDKLPVPEVAAQVGYQDRVAFGRLFKKLVGVSPGAYRQQHAPQ
ncbi:MAG: hypothetical protein RI907_3955 [Pseudomonadota bacterium]|jgi:transcriptional regulator GlxA family with amidase domain